MTQLRDSEIPTETLRLVEGKWVPYEDDYSKSFARPPTRLVQRIAATHGAMTAYVFMVLWHFAVVGSFKPFNFNRARYSSYGLHHTTVERALSRLRAMGLIEFEQPKRKSLIVSKVNRRPNKDSI